MKSNNRNDEVFDKMEDSNIYVILPMSPAIKKAKLEILQTML